MVFKITWSSLALETYISNLEYLEKAWTEREVKIFINAVQRILSILSLQPKIGRLTSKRLHVRQTTIHKRIILIYRFLTNKRRDRINPVLWNKAKSFPPKEKKIETILTPPSSHFPHRLYQK